MQKGCYAIGPCKLETKTHKVKKIPLVAQLVRGHIQGVRACLDVKKKRKQKKDVFFFFLVITEKRRLKLLWDYACCFSA